MYSDPVPLELFWPQHERDEMYERHKRTYVTINVAVGILRQIENRFSDLRSLLIEYDHNDEFHAHLREAAPSNTVQIDMGYVKRGQVIGAAWDLVDWLERFKKLVHGIAGVPRDAAWLKRLKAVSVHSEKVRHIAQHFDREVRQLVDGQYPLFGAVSVSFPSHSGGYTRVLTSTPVRYAKDSRMEVAGFQRALAPTEDADCVVFSLARESLNFSSVVAEMKAGMQDFAAFLESEYGYKWSDAM